MPMSSQTLLYDPSAPDFHERIYSVYDRLREDSPFHWSPQVREWLVSRHADAKVVLKHPALRPPDVDVSIAEISHVSGLPFPALRTLIGETTLFQSGTGHAQARRFLGRVLNQRSAAGMAPLIESIVAKQSARLRQNGGGDLVADFGRAVPLLFMGSLLGLPADEMEYLADCAEGLLLLLERETPTDRLVEMNSRAALAIDHLSGLCAERRRSPREDGLSRMMEASPGEDILADRTVAARAFFLFIAGLDTTTTFLGRSMLALLMNNGECDRWRRNEVADTNAIEELLRITSPVGLVIRQASDDIEVCGHFVARGQRVTALLEAANRDPAVFADSHRLDLGRISCPHLAFSDGVHACLGASLARIKGTIALREFIRLPAMRLNGTPDAYGTNVLRPLTHLPVEFF